jgi:hypothetical protein
MNSFLLSVHPSTCSWILMRIAHVVVVVVIYVVGAFFVKVGVRTGGTIVRRRCEGGGIVGCRRPPVEFGFVPGVVVVDRPRWLIATSATNLVLEMTRTLALIPCVFM